MLPQGNAHPYGPVPANMWELSRMLPRENTHPYGPVPANVRELSCMLLRGNGCPTGCFVNYIQPSDVIF